MNIVNGYLSEAEKQEMIALEQADIAVEKAFLAYNTFMEMKELKIRDIELRCMMESATYEDLQSYYEAEEEKSEEKEKGLIGTIWASIVGLFTKIRNFLFGDKAKQVSNAAQEHGEDGVEADSAFGKLLNNAKNLFTRAKKVIENKDPIEGAKCAEEIKNAKGTLKTASVVAVAGAAVVTFTVKNIAELYAFCDSSSKYFLDKATEFKNKKEDDKGFFGKAVNVSVSAICTGVGYIINKLCDGIFKLLSVNQKLKIADKLAEDADKSKKGITKKTNKKIDNLNATLKEKEDALAKETNSKKKTALTNEINNIKQSITDEQEKLNKKNTNNLNKANNKQQLADKFAKSAKKDEKEQKKKNKQQKSEEDEDETTEESVVDILGFDVPDAFLEDGSIEDDSREILDLFNTVLN